MFLDEARLAARIQHPNVVSTLDVVALDGELLVVLEYVHGESLAALLRKARKAKRPLPLKIVAAIASGMLHGLHAAHEATSELGQPLDIVHRDMSPHNVLVGLDGNARVLDFGVAKAAGRVSGTRDGQLKGKLPYMSPEQVGMRPVDRRSDIYSASIVLWEVLTGRMLFDGDYEAVVFAQVAKGTTLRPRELVPDLPPALDEIVMRGLAADPAARHQTAWDMAVAIEEAIGLASPRQVGEWVAETAGAQLATRALRVKEIESISSADFVAMTPMRESMGSSSAILVAAPAPAPPPADAPAVTPAEPADRDGPAQRTEVFVVPTSGPRPRWLVAGLGVLLVGGVLAWSQTRGPRPAEAAAPIATAVPTVAASATSQPPVPVATAAEPPPPVAPSASARPPASVRPQAARRPVAPAVDCNPPYSIDATGARRLKPQCL